LAILILLEGNVLLDLGEIPENQRGAIKTGLFRDVGSIVRNFALNPTE
jgi:hypothetical protein